MNIPDSEVYALVVGAVTAVGVAVASLISFRATMKANQNEIRGLNSQIKFKHAAKVAEFRQAWINDLRESMAILQSIGVTPDLQHSHQTEFYRAGTKIELLMNRNDERYRKLQECMYSFLSAETVEEKYLCNAPFVSICQDILKSEWEVLKKDFDVARASLWKVYSKAGDSSRTCSWRDLIRMIYGGNCWRLTTRARAA
jgi:hypothetical protein